MGTDEGQEEAIGLEKTPKAKAAPEGYQAVPAKGMDQVCQNLHVVNLYVPGAWSHEPQSLSLKSFHRSINLWASVSLATENRQHFPDPTRGFPCL